MKFSPEKRIAAFDLRFVFRKNLWIFFVILFALLLVIPFSTAGLPGNSIFNLEVTHLQMKFRYYTPEMVPVLLVLLPLFGLMAGCALFRFLLHKKDSSIFLSAGISRRGLFVNRTFAGAVMIFFGIAVPMAVSYFLNLRALGSYNGLLRNGIFLTAGLFLMAMTGFFTAAISIFASGTIIESCLYWFALMLLPSAICSGIGRLLQSLFFGNAFGVRSSAGSAVILPSLQDQGAFWNPVLFFRDSLETNDLFIRPLETAIPDPVNWKRLALWFAICTILSVLALILLKVRKAESAGIIGRHPVLSECVIFLSSFFVFSEAVSLLYSYSPVLAFILGSTAFTVLHLFWCRVVFSDYARAKGSIFSFAAGAAAVLLICLICSPVMNAHVKKFLQSDDIIRAEITYAGAPSYLYTEASGSTSGRGYYLLSTLPFYTDEAISLVKELQSSLIETGRQPLVRSDEADQTCLPCDILFSYLDAKGKEHTWYYDRATFAQLENMLSVETTAEGREGISSLFDEGVSADYGRVLSEQAYLSSDIYLTDPSLTSTYHLTLEPEKRRELLNALSADLSALSLEERYFPAVQSKAVLLFTGSGEQDSKYFTYHLDNEYLYINEMWLQTMNWLEENGLLELLADSPAVEEIYLQRFDPYIGINKPSPMGLYFMAYCADTPDEFLIQKDFGLKYTIDEPDEIASLLPNLQNGCYMSRGGFLACVKYEGQEKYRYFFLPQYLVPEFVKG